jgi:hypothetical protein
MPNLTPNWSQIVDSGLGAVTEMDGLAMSDAGWVLAGTRWTPDAGYPDIIWYSNDARHWQEAALPEAPLEYLWQIVDVAPFRGGFIAMGYGWRKYGSRKPPTTLALVSTDGQTWEVAGEFVGRPSSVATMADGSLIVFGDPSLGDGEGIWLSEDAVEWRKATSSSARHVDDGVLAFAVRDGTLFALRSDDRATSFGTPVELWRTTDGERWDKVVDLPAPVSVSTALMYAVGGEWVIAAERLRMSVDRQTQYAWYGWHSTDGVLWHAASQPALHPELILGDELGLLVIGRDYDATQSEAVQTSIWKSINGDRWKEAPDGLGEGREIDVAAIIDGQVVAIGIDWPLGPGPDEGGGQGVVWTVDRAELTP